jgi:hypothetical protein
MPETELRMSTTVSSVAAAACDCFPTADVEPRLGQYLLVSQMRIGIPGAGDWEIMAGERDDQSSKMSTGQFTWTSGNTYEFTLEYTATPAARSSCGLWETARTRP